MTQNQRIMTDINGERWIYVGECVTTIEGLRGHKPTGETKTLTGHTYINVEKISEYGHGISFEGVLQITANAYDEKIINVRKTPRKLFNEVGRLDWNGTTLNFGSTASSHRITFRQI